MTPGLCFGAKILMLRKVMFVHAIVVGGGGQAWKGTCEPWPIHIRLLGERRGPTERDMPCLPRARGVSRPPASRPPAPGRSKWEPVQSRELHANDGGEASLGAPDVGGWWVVAGAGHKASVGTD